MADKTIPVLKVLRGNVGIGSTTPTSNLEVIASGADLENMLRVTSGTAGRGVYIGAPQSATVAGVIDFRNGNVATRYLDFRGEGTSRMVIQTDGKVGIGTTAPGYALDVPSGIVRGQEVRAKYGSNNLIQLTWGDTTSEGRLWIGNNGGATVLINGNSTSYINNGANFGVGTSTPTRVLQVNGAAHATSHLVGSLTTALGIAGSFPDANDSELGPGYLVMTRDDTAAAKQLQFWKNGSLHSGLMTDTNGLNFVGSDGAADVTIKTDGKVGIGYGQPDYTLKVAGDCYVRDATTLDGTVSVGGTANGLLYIKEDNGSNTIQLRADVSNSYNEIDSQKEFNIRTEAGALRFSTANTERMRILADGKVGIGTTAPGARLQIHATRTSSTNVAALILSDNVTGTQTNGVYKSIRSISNGSSSVSEIRFLETDGTNNNTSIAFATAAVAGGLTERMRINQSGSVGIGTTSPATTLDVNGVTTARDYIRLGASAVHGSLTWLSSSPARLILFGASGRKLSLGSNGAYDKVTLDLNGYVGIGNTSPNNDQNVTDRVQLAIGNTAQVGGRKTGTPSWFNISHGTYFDGTNWKYYSAADEAALVEGYNGGLYARMAVAGTNAGDNITWVTALTVLNTGYVHMDGASQVRLTLGSQGTAGANDANWIRGTGTSLGFNAAGGGFHWEVSGTQRMALDSSGNLTINGNISNTAASAYYYLNNVGTGNSGLYVAGLSSRMRFHVPASNYYEWEIGGAHKMRLDADGDLGIGTNGPTQKLHVFGNILFGSSSKLGFNNDINSFVIDGGGTYGIEIDGWYGASLQSRSVIGVFVDELGNVGIGPTATNPDATGSKLQISSGTTANAANKFYDLLKLKGKNNTLNAVGMLFSIESTAGAAAGLDYSKGGIVYGPTSGWGRGAMHFLQEASNTTADADISDSVMTILNDGNVGINDTTPTYKLDVNGTFRVTGAATFDSSIGFATVLAGNGSAAAPSFAFTSDTNTGMYRGATDRLSFSTGGTDSLVLTTSDASFVGHLAFAGYLYSSSTAGRLITNTVDGSDTKAFYVCGGGDAGQGRGAYVSVYGNDHASAPGLLELLSGNDGSIAMYSGGAERVTINNNGSIQYNGDTQQSWIQFKDAGTLSGYIGAGIGLAASPNNLNTDFAIRAKTKLALCTNDSNAAKVTILADGKVGIGTATPAVKLHLDSGATTELRIDGEGHELITFHKSSAQKGLVGYSIGDSTLKLCAGSGTIASNVNGISINANGNVGIGTATPSAELHVKSPINQHCFLNIDTTTAAYNPVLELKEAGTRRAYINYVSASNYLSITTEESGSDIALMPLAGSVGIGTATPDTKLHVYYASPSPTMASITRANLDNLGILVEDSSLDNNNGEITCGITFGYVGESSSAIASVDEGGSGASGLGFVTGTIASVAERLRITNNGNVGIGTAVPAAMLEVIARASGGHPPLFLRRGATNESASLKLLTTTTEDWIVGMRNDGTSNFRIYSYGASSDVFSILRSNGNVGIGSATPAYALDVVGYAKVSLGIKVGGGSAGNSTNPAITVGSVNTAGVYFESSGVGFGSGSGTKKLFLRSDGDVGIGYSGSIAPPYGTTSPTILIIKPRQQSSDAALRLARFADDVVGLDIWADGGSGTHDSYFDNRYELSDWIFRSGTRGAGTIDEVMRVTGEGSVGIGTTAPECSLQVEKLTGGTNIMLSAGNYGTNYGQFELDSISVGLSSGNKVRAITILHSSQYVGIGNTTPNNNQNVTDRVQLAIGNTAQVGGRKTGTPSWFNISHGTYFDGTNWKYYSAADEAALVEGYNGGLYARMAVAGTNAGDNITWVTALTVLNTGYVHMDGASQVRLTLGSQGTAGNNDSNWIRGNGTSLGFNAAGGATTWEVSGAQKMSLSSAGALVIQDALTVNGNISNSAASTYFYLNNVGTGNSGMYIGGFSARMRFHVPASNYYEWEIGGAHKMRLDANGNLGIGTASPSSKLTIDGGNVEIRNGYDLMIRPSGNGNDFRLTALDTGGGDVVWGGATTTSIMRWANNGNVGIGTTTPRSKLDVRGDFIMDKTNNGYGGMRLWDDTTSDYNVYLDMGRDQSNTQFHIRYGGRTANSQTWNSGSDVAVFSLAKSWIPVGNVGIGTVTPAGRLHIIDGNVNLKMGDSVKRYTWHTSTGLTDGGGGTPQYYTIGTVDLTGLTYKNGYIKGTVTQGRSYITNPLYNFTFFFKITTGDAEGMLSVDVEGFNNGWLNVYQDDSTSKIFKFVLYNNFSNQVGLTYDIEYYAGAGTSHIADSDVTFITSVSGASSASAPSGYTIIPKSFLNYKDFNTGQNTFGLGTNATKVGIGTQNPGALLHIEGGASEISTQQLKVSSVWGQTSTPMVLFENRHDGNGLKITNNAARSDAELFEITNSGGTVVMVKGDGKVGIGTTAPSAVLDVRNGTVTQNAIYAQSDSSYGSPLYLNDVRSDTSMEFLAQFKRNNVLVGHIASDATQLRIGAPAGYVILDGADGTILRDSGTNKIIQNGSYFRPDANNNMYLGASAQRWAQVYSVQGNFSGTVTASALLNLSGTNYIHQLSGHNFVQGDATMTYLYGGSGGGQIRSTNNSSSLVQWLDNGKVGIGTTAPGVMLDLLGNTSDPLYPGIRGKHGSNTLYRLEQYFADEGYLALYLANTKTIQFRGGNTGGGAAHSYLNTGTANHFGIGTASPEVKLTVRQGVQDSGIRLYGHSAHSGSYMNFRIDSAGHTNLETSGGSYTKFDIGSGYFNLTTAANEPIYMDLGGTFYWRDRDASNTVRMQLDSASGNLAVTGNVTISNDKILSVGTTNGNSGAIRLYDGSSTSRFMDWEAVGTTTAWYRFNGGTSYTSPYRTYFNQQHPSAGHNLYVDGDITSMGTGRYIYAENLNVSSYKNFEIEHPTKENMMLVHSSLEGPEAAVYHRGRAQSDTITMPDYWSGLVREGTITVQLTPNGSFQHLYVVSTSLSEIKIGAAEGETIDCYYIIYGERADVAPLVVEDAAAWERFQERKAAMSDGKA